MINPFYLNSINDIQITQVEYEKSIYYGFAIVSFIAMLSILLSIRQLVLGRGNDSKRAIISLLGGICMGILCGFTTCLPLFL